MGVQYPSMVFVFFFMLFLRLFQLSYPMHSPIMSITGFLQASS